MQMTPSPRRGRAKQDGGGERSGDAAIGRQIMRFLRLMNAGADDAALHDLAMERNWLDGDGAPTHEGRLLVRGFDDVGRARGDAAL